MLSARATALVRRGLGLLATGRKDDAVRALACVDAALAIRRTLPSDDAASRFDLAGAWMNRAEALAAIDPHAHATAVVAAYDAAVPLLDSLPPADDPRFPRRLATALQNRVLARRRQDPHAWTAVPDLIRALNVLETSAGGSADVMLAAIWVNLADAQLAEPVESAWRRAIESAQRALDLLGSHEDADVDAAAVGLKARHVCCQAAARRLAHAVDGAQAGPALHVATDAADGGLALIARWEARGVARFRPFTEDFFEFGRRVYGAFQPQFVAEFEADHGRKSTAGVPTRG